MLATRSLWTRSNAALFVFLSFLGSALLLEVLLGVLLLRLAALVFAGHLELLPSGSFGHHNRACRRFLQERSYGPACFPDSGPRELILKARSCPMPFSLIFPM